MPLRSSWLLLGVLAGFTAPPAGRIRRVPAEYRTIQEAIDSAQAGDTVLVAPGRYVENIRFGGKGTGSQIDHSERRPPELRANLVQDGAEPGASLTRDPRFADSVHYYLAPDSPAVDAGDPALPGDPMAGGRPRAPALGKRRADLGAYGGTGSTVLLP